MTGRPLGLLVEPAGACPVCEGTSRSVAHGALEDRLCGTPGQWSLWSCGGCGTLILEPRLRPEWAALAYEHCAHHIERPGGSEEGVVPGRAAPGPVARAYLAHRYGYDAGMPRWRRALALLAVPFPEGAEGIRFSVMYLAPVAGAQGELLDIGCGGGAFLERMRALGWRGVGIEPDQRAREYARAARGLDVRAGTLQDQRFPEARFDAVTASHVIEHVHDPLGFLRECRRVTRPGGRVVVVTPNIGSLGRRRLGPAWIGLDPPRHLHLFSRGTLARLAARAGLEVRSARTSVRNAEFSWLLGRGLLREWPRPGQRPPGGLAGRRARIFQLAEWALTLAGVPAGEEIVLTAVRP